MIAVLRSSWPLLLGVLLLLLGNGMQGTVLGLRGAMEGYDAPTMSWVMSAYFAGFLIGARLTPRMIRRVGHVRVFAALGAVIAAAFVTYAEAVSPLAWMGLRFVVAFCFCGVYVTAESWLNEAATNESRGKALSLYMIAQMLGIISAQGIVALADPGGHRLFVVMSVLVSLSFLPILLSAGTAPSYRFAAPMTLRTLFRISPLGCVGTLLLGGIYAGLFSMPAVWGAERGLTTDQTAAFVASIYVGGLIALSPLGWLSDRMERRLLILALAAVGASAAILALPLLDRFAVVLALGALLGAVTNPLYSLLIAYTNDFLSREDMPAASGGLQLMNGAGAILGTLALGGLMGRFGPDAFFALEAALFAVLAGYALWRATRRAAPPPAPHTPVTAQASPVALESAARSGR